MVKKSMFGVFNNRNFLKLFIAGFTSSLGDVASTSAFTYYLLNRFSHQPYYTNIMEMMYTLPTLLVFFIVGVVADRMDRQKIAFRSDWIRAILTLVLLLAVKTAWMPLIFAIVFTRSAVGKFFEPAQNGLIQGILPREDMVSAAGLNQTTASLFMLFGSGIGAVLYWTVGIEGAVLVDCASFLVSGTLIRACRIAPEVRLPNGPSKLRDLKFGTVLHDFKLGSLYILRYRLLFFLMLGLFVLGFVNGFAVVIPVFLLKYKLAPDNFVALAATNSIVFGCGYLIGSPFSTRLAKKMPLHKMMTIGFFIATALIYLQGMSTTTWMFLGTEFFTAISITMINVAFFGWFPQIVDPQMMGRVQAWKSPLMFGATSLTLGLVAIVFPAYVRVETLYKIESLLMLVTSMIYLLTLPRLVKQKAEQEACTATTPLHNTANVSN